MKHQLENNHEVFIGGISGRGGHGASIIVTKINRRSIKGIERERSYKPGTVWTIQADTEIAVVGKDAEGRMTNRWGMLGDYGRID